MIGLLLALLTLMAAPPPEGQLAPPGTAFAYAGENVGAAAARCARDCGTSAAIGSPGASCLCWRPNVKTPHGIGVWEAIR